MLDFKGQPIRDVVLRVRLQRSLGPHILEQYIADERIESFSVNIIDNSWRTYNVEFLRKGNDNVKLTIYSSLHEVYGVFDSINKNAAINILKQMWRDFESIVQKYSFCFFLNAKYKEEE